MGYECRVTERGILHLFAPLHIGAVCVCGRKVAEVREGGLTIGDMQMDVTAPGLDATDRLAPRLALRRCMRSRRALSVAGPHVAGDHHLFLAPAVAGRRLSESLPSRMC
jgi:hypothetical protein